MRWIEADSEAHIHQSRSRADRRRVQSRGHADENRRSSDSLSDQSNVNAGALQSNNVPLIHRDMTLGLDPGSCHLCQANLFVINSPACTGGGIYMTSGVAYTDAYFMSSDCNGNVEDWTISRRSRSTSMNASRMTVFRRLPSSPQNRADPLNPY